MALVLILLAYAKIILEEDECQTEDNASMTGTALPRPALKARS